jgi:hypothetical protein
MFVCNLFFHPTPSVNRIPPASALVLSSHNPGIHTNGRQIKESKARVDEWLKVFYSPPLAIGQAWFGASADVGEREQPDVDGGKSQNLASFPFVPPMQAIKSGLSAPFTRLVPFHLSPPFVSFASPLFLLFPSRISCSLL